MESSEPKVKEFLCMKQGEEEFSYALNTIIQSTTSCKAKYVIEKAINDILSEFVAADNPMVRMVDLGCGVGPVPLAFILTVIETVHKRSPSWDDDNQVPEIQICLNDLVSNDYNQLLREISKFQVVQEHHESDERQHQSYFVMCVHGSFHDRLFPRNSLHFVHSNYALHWLSQVPSGLLDEQGSPLNKRNINVTGTTPGAAAEAYVAQFHKDWTLFLKNRFREMLPYGRLLLVVRGRSSKYYDQPPTFELHLLCQAMVSLVSQGVIEEEKLDRFEFPTYCPSMEEVQEVVRTEGSFEIEHMDTIVDYVAQEIEDSSERAKAIAKSIRAFTETVVLHHFGEQVLHALYTELQLVTVEYLASAQKLELCSILVVLKRSRCSSIYKV